MVEIILQAEKISGAERKRHAATENVELVACKLEHIQGQCLEQRREGEARGMVGHGRSGEGIRSQKEKACVHANIFHPEGSGELWKDFKQWERSRILQCTQQPP